jgi:hypothetical protein
MFTTIEGYNCLLYIYSMTWQHLEIYWLMDYCVTSNVVTVIMVVGFTTTYTNSAYYHWCCEIRARCTTLCDKICRWLVTGRCFSPGPPVFSTNKTDRHDITEILLKVAFKHLKPKPNNLTNSISAIFRTMTNSNNV